MFRNRERSLWKIALTVVAVAIAFFFFRRPGDMGISARDQVLLLDWARQQLVATAQGEGLIAVPFADITDDLQHAGSAFVSLYEGDRLRGCMIDDFVSHEPLYRNILRNTALAASGDNRFPPVGPEEVDGLRIAISIITEPEALSFDDPEDLVRQLQPGVDGVVLAVDFVGAADAGTADEGDTGKGVSAYLPSVWETFPDPEEFLSQLCLKQDLRADRWREMPYPRIETFRTFDFGESS